MTPVKFDRDALARFYAKRHLRTDPGIQLVLYLPNGAPEREIRLLEVNELMAERNIDPLEPIDFGVDRWDPNSSHLLMVLDVSPRQLEKIQKKKLSLPDGWTLEGAVAIPRK